MPHRLCSTPSANMELSRECKQNSRRMRFCWRSWTTREKQFFLVQFVRRMGRNRKWVLEDSLQEAVWRTIIRGPRPPSTRWPQRAKRSASAATLSKVHSPPSSRPTKVQPAAPKSNVSSIQAAIRALGADPDPAVLASFQEALQRAKESSSPSTHVQAEPGKSPDARVAEAQARVSRLQAALDLLGADNPDAELLKASLETAKRQCRVQPVGERLDSCLKFVERAQGRIERQKKNCRGSTATLDQVRISVGRRVARFGTAASRSPCMSGTSSVSHRAFDRNNRVAGFAARSGAVFEEGAERVVGKAEFPVHERYWGFSVFSDGRID